MARPRFKKVLSKIFFNFDIKHSNLDCYKMSAALSTINRFLFGCFCSRAENDWPWKFILSQLFFTDSKESWILFNLFFLSTSKWMDSGLPVKHQMEKRYYVEIILPSWLQCKIKQSYFSREAFRHIMSSSCYDIYNKRYSFLYQS